MKPCPICNEQPTVRTMEALDLSHQGGQNFPELYWYQCGGGEPGAVHSVSVRPMEDTLVAAEALWDRVVGSTVCDLAIEDVQRLRIRVDQAERELEECRAQLETQ